MEPIEITVKDDRPHTMQVKKGGFETATRTFTYRKGKGEPIRVSMKRKPQPNLPPDPAKPPPPAGVVAENKGFTSLFNGKDLKGWVVDSGDENAWKVENEDLIVHGSEEGGQLDQSYLLTERNFKDFRLRFQFQWSNNTGLSGIALRAVPHETRRTAIPDLPVELDGPFHLWVALGKHREKEETGSVVWSSKTDIQPWLIPDQLAEIKPIGEWNDMEVEMRGQSLRIAVNGRDIQNVKLNKHTPLLKYPAPGVSRFSGRIGFLKRVGEVRFRKIEIKELSEVAAK